YLVLAGSKPTSKYNKDTLTSKVTQEQQRQEQIDLHLPRLLDVNFHLPEVGPSGGTDQEEESPEGDGLTFFPASKRMRVDKPQSEPLSLAFSLRKTSKKTKILRGNLRPHTLQQIYR